MAVDAHRADLDPTSVVIPGVTLGRLLGAGGGGVVLAGVRDSDGRQLAVKVARRVADPRFDRERAALLRLGPPHTPDLLGSGTCTGGRPYLLLERLQGETLAELASAAPAQALPQADALALVARIAAALDRVHAASLIHRDIKPSNIWLRPSGQVCLLDFGLARTETEVRMTRAGVALGTLQYMAPEQVLGDPDVGPAADIYALGAVAYRLLTGRPPFSGTEAELRHAHLALRPESVARSGAPAALDDVLLRAMAKDPARRHPSAVALADALLDAVSQPQAQSARADGAPAQASHREVTLLFASNAGDPSTAAHIAAAEGGLAVTLESQRCVLAFVAEPVRAAVGAARRTADRLPPGTDAIIHVAQLAVRDGPRGLLLAGAALDSDPREGALQEARPGLRLTAAAAAHVDLADSAASSVAADALAEAPPLRGRSRELARCLDIGRAALHGDTGASLTSLIAESGIGKSLLLAALGDQLRRDSVDVIAVAHAGDDSLDWLTRGLIRPCIDLPVGSPDPDELRSRLGDIPEWPAVALALGALPPSAPQLAALRSAPSALRLAQARATASALIERARRRPLAILVDDAHLAEHAALDALELASMAQVPLWLVVTAAPTLRTTRPHWGRRARTAELLELGPLSADEASAAIIDRLHPVVDIPQRVLVRLRELCGDVPARIHELTHALRRRGAIRRHRGSSGWYLASELVFDPTSTPTPLAARLAADLRSQLSPPMWRLVRVCAALGASFEAEEVDAVQRKLGGEAVDPWVGLARLQRLFVLESTSPGRFRFGNALLRDAIEPMSSPEHRRSLHRAAYDALRTRGVSAARLARHAAAAAARREAYDAYLAAADEDLRRHRYVDAEGHYTAALQQLSDAPEDADRRAHALARRGCVRYRVQRHGDALDDLRSARAHAESVGDDRAIAALLLEEAIVQHWCYRFAEDAALVAQATPLIERLDDAELRARWLLALGRSHFYAQRVAEAIDSLTRAATLAQQLGDSETRTLSLSLLAYVLVLRGAPYDDAERCFDELFELCAQTGDRFQLGVAHTNRVTLRVDQGRPIDALYDAGRAAEIARELGNLMLERSALYNRAEVLYFLGRHDQALELAVRCREIQALVFERPGPEETLLLARIAASREDEPAARAHLQWLEEHCPRDTRFATHDVLIAMVELAIERAPASAWAALVERALDVELMSEERAELLAFASGERTEAQRRRDQPRAEEQEDDAHEQVAAARDPVHRSAIG